MQAKRWLQVLAAGVILGAAAIPAAQAEDKVRIGVNPVSSSLPLYVGLAKGYFKDEGLEIEQTQLIGAPPNVAALISGQIDVASNLTTIDAANAQLKKPGVAMYIAINSQNRTYQMEQFVVREGLVDKVKTLKDFKGLKLMSAPGPANLNTAKGILAKMGLKDGDYTIDQLDMGQHVNALKAGTFDGGYTLEPSATIMANIGAGKTIEAGVIAKYILGDPKADAFAAGCALSSDFIAKRPDVAKRFADAWAKAIVFINKEPDAARKYLAKNTMTPDNVVDTVPMLGYIMTKDMNAKQLGYLQTFTDFGTEIGVVPEKIDVKKYLKSF